MEPVVVDKVDEVQPKDRNENINPNGPNDGSYHGPDKNSGFEEATFPTSFPEKQQE